MGDHPGNDDLVEADEIGILNIPEVEANEWTLIDEMVDVGLAALFQEPEIQGDNVPPGHDLHAEEFGGQNESVELHGFGHATLNSTEGGDINWAMHDQWTLDLEMAHLGERVVASPLIRNGNLEADGIGNLLEDLPELGGFEGAPVEQWLLNLDEATKSPKS